MKKSRILIILSLFFFDILNSQNAIWSKKANPAGLTLNSIAFRADGKKILTGTNCHPAYIRVFDTSSTLEWDFQVGNSFMCIMGVTFSSNGNYIAAIEEFGNIFIFDNTGSNPVIIDTVNTGTSYGFSTAISDDNSKLAVGCSNGKLLLYDLTTRTLLKSIVAHPNWVTSVCFSHSNSIIISGGDDNKVKTWDLSGTLLNTFTGHSDDITGVRISLQDSFILSSSKDKFVKIWNASTGSLIRTLSGHNASVNGIDLSPDGNEIVSVSSDSTAKIWDFVTGELLNTFGIKDSGAIQSVAWSPKGDRIATGSDRSDLVLWKIDKQQDQFVISISTSPLAGGTATGGGTYKKDSSISVVAVENLGYKFSNWTENKAIISTSKNYNFKVTKDRTLVANFAKLNSIITLNPNTWDIHPNPTSEVIHLKGLDVNEIETLEIYNLKGQICYKTDVVSKDKLDIRFLDQGVYLLRLTNKENSGTKIFVKE